jgi:DNA transformation protein
MARDPSTPVSDLRNLGPVTARRLAEIDVDTLGDLAGLGSVEAYARLRFRFGRQVTLNALYALEAALRDVDGRSLSAADKRALVESVALRGKGRRDA